MFGFLGPNGAGKTTTIRTLLDFLHPTAGSARIFGLDTHRDSVRIRRRIGNLPGDFGYGKGATGREALDLPRPAARRLGARSRPRSWRERFRADLDRPLGQLSRGNRQKVGLILAFFHQPDLLILDEPTGGLDPLMREEFLALVGEERDRGRAVFISSHELSEVERVCDRVGIIREGRLIAVERVADLIGKTRRKVTVEFAAPVTLDELERLPGVTEVSGDGGRVTFMVAGDLNPILHALAEHVVTDLEIAHPSLEEVFLAYYRDEGRQ